MRISCFTDKSNEMFCLIFYFLWKIPPSHPYPKSPQKRIKMLSTAAVISALTVIKERNNWERFYICICPKVFTNENAWNWIWHFSLVSCSANNSWWCSLPFFITINLSDKYQNVSISCTKSSDMQHVKRPLCYMLIVKTQISMFICAVQSIHFLFLTYTTVAINSVNGQQQPWSAFAKVQAGQGLSFLQIA